VTVRAAIRGVVVVAWVAGLPTPVGGQETDVSRPRIAEAVAEARRACEADGGRLWGRSLCGPFLFVDTAGRRLISSLPAPEAGLAPIGRGLFEGPVPDDLPVANRAIDWAGIEWAMVLLPLPADPEARIDLLLHESFHRVQDELGLGALERPMDHLAQEDGRVWMRLEMRALGRALAADSVGGQAALQDALLFRARRYALYPEAQEAEAALELQEGLPAYTGVVLATRSRADSERRAGRILADFEVRGFFSRSFAYATGPALGLLADRYARGWRAIIARQRDLAGLLAESLAPDPGGVTDAEVDTRAGAYGREALATEEATRQKEADRSTADYRDRLVEGPVLVLPLAQMQMTFDPLSVTPLGADGTVYPTLTLGDRWGTLTVERGGALIAADFSRASVPLTTSASCGSTGPGWTLDLVEGWVVVPGDRSTDCTVAEPRIP
jgi:hypothetical protein